MGGQADRQIAVAFDSRVCRPEGRAALRAFVPLALKIDFQWSPSHRPVLDVVLPCNPCPIFPGRPVSLAATGTLHDPAEDLIPIPPRNEYFSPHPVVAIAGVEAEKTREISHG